MRRMTRGVLGCGLAWVVFLAWSAASAAAEPARAESRKPQIPELKVETYTLPNGLTVILHEDHKTPVVAVNVLYKVGSKDEKPGRTGFAHLFEHMMFQGSKHHDTDYFLPLEKLGAELNGDDRRGPDGLLRDRSQQCARAGALARGRSDGLPAAGDDAGEARQPARRGQERAAANRSTTSRTARPRRRCSRPSIPRTILITTA